MSKRAELRRQQKAASKPKVAVYHFTVEEMREHDMQVRRAFMENAKAEWERVDRERDENARKLVEAEWTKQRELFDGEQMQLVLSLLLACSCRVLIEKFHWKPVRQDRRKTRTEMFAEWLADEIGKITMSERKDVMEYCNETDEKYGVRFKFGEVEEE